MDIQTMEYVCAGQRTIFVLTKVDMAERSGIKQQRVSNFTPVPRPHLQLGRVWVNV